MLNPTDLAYLEEVEARYNESTPGQWTLPLYGYTIETAEKKLFFAFGMGEPAFADMRFVCAAHTDIPRLIAMVRAGDAVPVVRCHDCDSWEPFGCKQERGACDEWSDYERGMMHYTGRNEFCGRGKPRVEHEDFAAKRTDADASQRAVQDAQQGGEVGRDG